MVTLEQRKTEKRIEQEIIKYRKKSITKREANNNIQKIIDEAFERGIFTKKDIDGLNYRRDKKNMRSYVDFWNNICESQEKEHIIFLDLIEKIEEKYEKVEWETYGTDIKGGVIIASFKERIDSPNLPDYKVKINNKICLVESKSFLSKKGQVFKRNNLEMYKKQKAFLIVGINGYLFLYKPKAIDKLLSLRSKGSQIGGKPAIRVGNDLNCEISLDFLQKEKLVKKIQSNWAENFKKTKNKKKTGNNKYIFIDYII